MRNNKGFTFIEVLISMIVLSVVLIYFLNSVVVSKNIREVSTSNISQKAYTSNLVEEIKNEGLSSHLKNKTYFELNKDLKPSEQYVEQIDVTNPRYTTTLKVELDEETKGIKGIAKEKNVFVDDVSYVNLDEHLSNYLKVSGYDGSKISSNSKIGIKFQLDVYSLDNNYYKLKVTSEIQGKNVFGNFPDKLVKYTTEHKVKKDNKITFKDQSKWSLTFGDGSDSLDYNKLNKNKQNIVVVEIPRFKYASSKDEAVSDGKVWFDLPTNINTDKQNEWENGYLNIVPNDMFLTWYPLWNNAGNNKIYDWNSIVVTGRYHDGIQDSSDKPSICFVVKKNDGNYMNYFGIAPIKSTGEMSYGDRSRFIEIFLNNDLVAYIKLEDYEINNPVYVGNIPKIRYMYRTDDQSNEWHNGIKMYRTEIDERGKNPPDRLWFVNGDLDKFLVKSENKTDDYSDVKYRNYLCTVESVDKKTNGKIKYTFKVPK